MDNLLYQDETYSIRNAVFEVYKRLGPGLLESVYQEALEKEFQILGICYQSQCKQEIFYRGTKLKQYYIIDFLCFDKIIIEIKAVKELNEIHRAQLLNYMKLSRKNLGFLINFCSHPNVKIERFIQSKLTCNIPLR